MSYSNASDLQCDAVSKMKGNCEDVEDVEGNCDDVAMAAGAMVVVVAPAERYLILASS